MLPFGTITLELRSLLYIPMTFALLKKTFCTMTHSLPAHKIANIGARDIWGRVSFSALAPTYK